MEKKYVAYFSKEKLSQFGYIFCRLVHAITPLEENKSFLEKVQFGEKLCGIRQEASLLNLWRSQTTSAGQTSITSEGYDLYEFFSAGFSKKD